MKKQLSDDLINILKKRFEENMNRHSGLEWSVVEDRLSKAKEKLYIVSEMEKTGGEPDIVDFGNGVDEYIFCDCAKESPLGRRSLCYDRQALDARKEHKPIGSAVEMAQKLGVEILNENEYRKLQEFGVLDAKTSSWIKTPIGIRKLGGALFSDFRYGTVFVYHNGASSYYKDRGFRGLIKIK